MDILIIVLAIVCLELLLDIVERPVCFAWYRLHGGKKSFKQWAIEWDL